MNRAVVSNYVEIWQIIEIFQLLKLSSYFKRIFSSSTIYWRWENIKIRMPFVSVLESNVVMIKGINKLKRIILIEFLIDLWKII